MDVLLYATQNPRNLGSIIRTSVEFGLKKINFYDKFGLLTDYEKIEEIETK